MPLVQAEPHAWVGGRSYCTWAPRVSWGPFLFIKKLDFKWFHELSSIRFELVFLRLLFEVYLSFLTIFVLGGKDNILMKILDLFIVIAMLAGHWK